MAEQRSAHCRLIAIAAVVVSSLLSLQATRAATHEVSGAMQIFHLNQAFRPITPIRPTSAVVRDLVESNANVSHEFVQEIEFGLTKIPDNVLRALSSHGYRVLISESLVDAVPAAKNQQVRGYQPHSTWDTVYGMFNRNTRRVVMAEKALQAESSGRRAMVPLRDRQRREGILRHEFGHAVDQYLGNYSHSPEFIAAYEQGAKTISTHEAKVLSYYLQKGHAGREETFAEIFASLDDYACDRKSDILLKNHFPELVSLVRNRVSKISA